MKMSWCYLIMIALCLDNAAGMKAHSLKMSDSNVSNVSFLGHQEAHVAKGGTNVETNVELQNPTISNFVGCPSEFPNLVVGVGYQGDFCTGNYRSVACPIGCYLSSSKCLKAGTRSLCDVQDRTMCIPPFVVSEPDIPTPDTASTCKLSNRFRASTIHGVAPKGCLTMLDLTHSSLAVQSNQFASPFMLVQLTSQKCVTQYWNLIEWGACSETANVLWETIPSAAIPSFMIKSQYTKKCLILNSYSSGSTLHAASVSCEASDERLWFTKLQFEGTWQFLLQHVKSGLCIQTVSGYPKASTDCTLAGTTADGPTEQFPVVQGDFLLYYPRTAGAVGAYTKYEDTTADSNPFDHRLRFGSTNPLDKWVHFRQERESGGDFRITRTSRRRVSKRFFASPSTDLELHYYKFDIYRKIFVGGGGLFFLQNTKANKCLSLDNKWGYARFVSECKKEDTYETFRMLPAKVPPCRVSSQDAPSVQAPFVGWKLVASSTHGLTTQIEVGVSSMKGKAVTTEEAKEFQNSLSAGATVGIEAEAGVVFAKTKVSAEFRVDSTKTWTSSSANARSTESASTQEKVTSVGVSCPDPDPSMKMEYIYQWVGENGKIVVKTEHFRCHQTDGPEYPPECPPQLCGDPKTNPYCAAGPEGCGGRDGKSR
eukprot:Skav234002  [mRNA]  locus=scaffold2637:36590:38737:- [translate_table: standard]